MATTDPGLNGQPLAGAVQPPGAAATVDAHVLRLRTSQLRSQLASEREQRQLLERAVARARAELAEARLELAGIRAGEQRALHQALHDSLTSLPNRRHFHDRLDQQLRSPAAAGGPVLAVMYLDLDGFKPINDRHGHAAGDEVLKIVAARLAHAVRAEDLMSRLGGDEFACLLANQPQRAQLRGFGSKLLAIVAAPMTVAGQCFRVSPSIGVALAPADGRTADALLRAADAAMFQAKRHHRGIAFFDECHGTHARASIGGPSQRDAAPQGENVKAG